MYMKLDYFYFLAFDFVVKVTEILKYILLFSGENVLHINLSEIFLNRMHLCK